MTSRQSKVATGQEIAAAVDKVLHPRLWQTDQGLRFSGETAGSGEDRDEVVGLHSEGDLAQPLALMRTHGADAVGRPAASRHERLPSLLVRPCSHTRGLEPWKAGWTPFLPSPRMQSDAPPVLDTSALRPCSSDPATTHDQYHAMNHHVARGTLPPSKQMQTDALPVLATSAWRPCSSDPATSRERLALAHPTLYPHARI